MVFRHLPVQNNLDGSIWLAPVKTPFLWLKHSALINSLGIAAILRVTKIPWPRGYGDMVSGPLTLYQYLSPYWSRHYRETREATNNAKDPLTSQEFYQFSGEGLKVGGELAVNVFSSCWYSAWESSFSALGGWPERSRHRVADSCLIWSTRPRSTEDPKRNSLKTLGRGVPKAFLRILWPLCWSAALG